MRATAVKTSFLSLIRTISNHLIAIIPTTILFKTFGTLRFSGEENAIQVVVQPRMLVVRLQLWTFACHFYHRQQKIDVYLLNILIKRNKHTHKKNKIHNKKIIKTKHDLTEKVLWTAGQYTLLKMVENLVILFCFFMINGPA